MNRAAGSVADATGNWVDSIAPAWSRPYLRLARLDRPIGSWLLLLPCWWSAALSAGMAHQIAPLPRDIALFFVGAFAMRGAGCTWNDIVDRDLDGAVERTRSRPIPSGQVSVAQAALFLVLQALIGFAVLITFNSFTIALGIASLFATGLLAASVAPTARGAAGIGWLLFFPNMFLAGIYFPTEEMSSTMRQIGNFTPLGSALHAVRDSWMGIDPRPEYLGIMAAWALVAGALAARFFRWEQA